jgi:hypothetical protein
VGNTIHTIVLNGTDLSQPDDKNPIFKANRVHLPLAHLKETNTLSIHYTNDFNHEGVGFHQFTDPEDKQVTF